MNLFFQKVLDFIQSAATLATSTFTMVVAGVVTMVTGLLGFFDLFITGHDIFVSLSQVVATIQNTYLDLVFDTTSGWLSLVLYSLSFDVFCGFFLSIFGILISFVGLVISFIMGSFLPMLLVLIVARLTIKLATSLFPSGFAPSVDFDIPVLDPSKFLN